MQTPQNLDLAQKENKQDVTSISEYNTCLRYFKNAITREIQGSWMTKLNTTKMSSLSKSHGAFNASTINIPTVFRKHNKTLGKPEKHLKKKSLRNL